MVRFQHDVCLPVIIIYRGKQPARINLKACHTNIQNIIIYMYQLSSKKFDGNIIHYFSYRQVTWSYIRYLDFIFPEPEAEKTLQLSRYSTVKTLRREKHFPPLKIVREKLENTLFCTFLAPHPFSSKQFTVNSYMHVCHTAQIKLWESQWLLRRIYGFIYTTTAIYMVRVTSRKLHSDDMKTHYSWHHSNFILHSTSSWKKHLNHITIVKYR